LQGLQVIPDGLRFSGGKQDEIDGVSAAAGNTQAGRFVPHAADESSNFHA
jgi:hypothetical protein